MNNPAATYHTDTREKRTAQSNVGKERATGGLTGFEPVIVGKVCSLFESRSVGWSKGLVSSA